MDIDHRAKLENLVQQFSSQNLINFLRAASGSFRPQKEDFNQYLDNVPYIKELIKLGEIDFTDGRRLIALAGQVDTELTSQSGKQKQYEIARKVLKGELYDAGIFAFHDPAGHFRFSLITAQYKGTKRAFSSFRRYTYFVSPESSAHTFVNQIGKADFASIESILEAFSVEPVTKEFYTEYEKIFREAEASILLDWNAEQKRLYTQKFFNRLMFLAFLERKGWMTFNGRRDYLRALFDDYQHNDPDKRREANFHRKRLNTLFFRGLNNPDGQNKLADPQNKIFREMIGNVPYLNGGLFEEEADDIDGPPFPDIIVLNILKDLVYHFNFTVTESTPLDIEVAVDPEMLGKIFEELVTGRHESGSYYTVKPVVAFMCHEALKGYLRTALPAEEEPAIAKFVDEKDSSLLRDPEAALQALRAVKVCDPACGSGAYLLGMLHVLLELRECLFVTRSLDPKTVYDRKLEIIQNNLYGVDIDPFAVNIARLRLWLSLIVDYEGDNPPPLPNLDFKIEAGDSLTAPDPSGGLQPDMFRQQQVKEFLRLKNDFMSIHAGQAKKKELAAQIQDLRAKIKEWAYPVPRNSISQVGRNEISSYAFDWQVDFAEVFAPELAESTLSGKMVGIVNTAGGQMELTNAPKQGGFDIVLANPPYVRQELLGAYKEQALKPVYPEVYSGMADLYVYFYARAHQLLKNGGVACFISSNKWLRTGYGEKLREHLLDKQAFLMVVDFGELPVFQTAATFPAIFLWQKQARGETPTKWAVVKNLQECYDEGITEHVTRIAETLPATQFGKDKPRLSSSFNASKRTQMESSGITLKEYVNGQTFFGIKTGLNNVFVIDRAKRDELIQQDRKSEELIKPVLIGDEVQRYEICFREKYLIYVSWGAEIQKYKAIYSYLKSNKDDLLTRAEASSGRHPWYALTRYASNYVELFEKPKIFVPAFAMAPRFAMDNGEYYFLGPAYFVSSNDYYLLGVLNSQITFSLLMELCSVLGDQEARGRAVLRPVYFEKLPIPDAPQSEREAVAKLAEQAQALHTQRRKRVEQFLRAIGIGPAQSTSRNPLEAPWLLTAEEFVRRVSRDAIPTYKAAHEETLSVTEEIVRVEKEIDERVKSLYGL